ncbi:MAG: hypothetical protein HC769_13350 [Cyanobacteria bacterium CRU_2_1]|nr:hypothetical protein [Cyanobacteria bacterium RU_5_0]NJR59735.1 hypothetical protein [Cyanobacteria bacterium CRU_2_1]
MKKSSVELIHKFRKDLFRFNDPTVGWGESDRYRQCLVWSRTILTFGLSVLILGLLVSIYIQLREEPYQRFLRTCEQRRQIDATSCTSQWDPSNS